MAIPIVVIYSGCLAVLTWVNPPPEIEFYKFSNPMLSIYHLNMVAVALLLACYTKGKNDAQNEQISQFFRNVKTYIRI